MVFEEDGGVVLLVMEEVKLGRSLGESSPATRCRRWLAGVGAGEGRSSLGGGEDVGGWLRR